MGSQKKIGDSLISYVLHFLSVNYLIESLKIMGLAQQKCQIGCFTLVKIGQVDLAVAILAFCALLVEN